MDTRDFPKKCGKCRQRTVALATVPYTIQIDHDGRKYDVHIPALSVPQCTNCGEIAIDATAEKAIDNAFRLEAELLTPEQIRAGRKAAGFTTQQSLADLIKVAVSTLSRWETGAQVQQRSLDLLMRLAFEVPEARLYLEELQSEGRADFAKLSVIANTFTQVTVVGFAPNAQPDYAVAQANGTVLTLPTGG